MTLALHRAISSGLGAMGPDDCITVNPFHVAQQDPIVSSTGNSIFVTDQNAPLFTGPGITHDRYSQPFPSAAGIRFGYRLKVTTAKPSLSAGDYVILNQNIEGNRLARLGWGTVLATPMSVGFMLRANYTGVGYLNVRNITNDRTFLRRFTFNANEDTFVPLWLPGETTGTWPIDTGGAMQLGLSFASGTTFHNSADAWLTGNFIAGADVTNIAATLNNEVIVSGLVAFPGTSPPPKEKLPFLQREYEDELRLAMRYWQPLTVSARANTGTVLTVTAPPAVPMRATPTSSLRTAGTLLNISTRSYTPSQNRFEIASAAAGEFYVLGEVYALNARM